MQSVSQRRRAHPSVEVRVAMTYKAPTGPPFSMADPEPRNKPYKNGEHMMPFLFLLSETYSADRASKGNHLDVSLG